LSVAAGTGLARVIHGWTIFKEKAGRCQTVEAEPLAIVNVFAQCGTVFDGTHSNLNYQDVLIKTDGYET
jgi:hypothetical protein